MAADEVLTEEFLQDGIPIFRLYRWRPTVSLGRGQDLSGLIDPKTLRSNDMGSVRRMTGGGALFHGNDLSYSVICGKDELATTSLKEGYKKLSAFLVELYENFGFKAKYPLWDEKVQAEPEKICLASKEPYDLQILGQKIGGHAQRHRKGTVFQHGTIPIFPYDPVFEKLFPAKNDSATLWDLGVETEYETVKKETIKAFEKSFGTVLKKSVLDEKLLQRIEDLKTKKYDTKDWTLYGRTSQA